MDTKHLSSHGKHQSLTSTCVPSSVSSFSPLSYVCARNGYRCRHPLFDQQEGSPKVVYGTYTIRKWEVEVEIPNPWSWVNFTLQLANGERGRFTHLVMLRHSSVPRNDTRVGRCHHTVKSSDFFTVREVGTE